MGEPRGGSTNPFPRRHREVDMGEPAIARKPVNPPVQAEATLDPEASPFIFGNRPFRMNPPDAPPPPPRRWGIQAKLTIGQPNDVYEQEADRVAEQVMSMGSPATPTVQGQAEEEEPQEIQTKPLAETITPLVQRQEMLEEEEPIQAKCEACKQEEPIQRVPDLQAAPDSMPPKKGTTKIDEKDATLTASGKTITEAITNLTSQGKGEAGSVTCTPGWTQKNYQGDKDPEPIVYEADVQVTETKAMPVWTELDQQCDPVRKEWKRFYSALDKHENGHIAIDEKAFKDLHKKLLGKKQSEADKVFNDTFAQANTNNDAYDASTQHGLSQGTKVSPVQCGIEKVPQTSDNSGAEPLTQDMSGSESEVQTKFSTPAIQRYADRVPQVQPDLENQLNATKSGGSPLPNEVRSFMEPRFGADFSQVRVHTGSESVQMNRDLNAQAFAHKQDIYFGSGKSPGNNALTAHELTHVVQQTNPSSSIQRSLIKISDANQRVQKDDLAEAERVRKLNEDYENAVTTKDWQKAAELLNAFNRQDILARLSKLKRGQIGAIHQGALENSRVGPDSQVAGLTKAAHLDLNYENEIKAGRWEQAAVFLNGFNDTDIRSRLQKLKPEELRALFVNCPQWATRVTGAIAALDPKAATRDAAQGSIEFEIEPDDPAHPGQINLKLYNPRSDPLYVDRRITAVGYGIYLGGYYLYCEGLAQPVFVPQSYVNFGLTNAVNINDTVYSDHAAANSALSASPSKIGLPQYAYYTGAGGALIAPTVFSPATTPRTVQTMLVAMKTLADEVQKELVVLALSIIGGMAIKAVISRIARVGEQEPSLPKPKSSSMPDAEAFVQARNARNNIVNEYHGLPKAQRDQIATVTGGVNVETGQVAAGYNTAGKCAEDVVVGKLGGDPSKVRFSEAVRPRTGQQVPVCERCQGKYTKDQFAEGAIFAGPGVKMPKPGQ